MSSAKHPREPNFHALSQDVGRQGVIASSKKLWSLDHQPHEQVGRPLSTQKVAFGGFCISAVFFITLLIGIIG